jgi:hypothetical protein
VTVVGGWTICYLYAFFYQQAPIDPAMHALENKPSCINRACALAQNKGLHFCVAERDDSLPQTVKENIHIVHGDKYIIKFERNTKKSPVSHNVAASNLTVASPYFSPSLQLDCLVL